MAEEEKKYIKTEGYDDLVFPESGGATHSEPAETTESVFPSYNDIEVISPIIDGNSNSLSKLTIFFILSS